MHIEHMHGMIERLTDCTKLAIENDDIFVGKYPIGDVVDMIKDLCEAEYYAHIVKAMKEAKEKEEEDEKLFLRMLKEERADEYKKMRKEYGDEEGERRFYDHYRYRNGRFAPKGHGTRRGYDDFMPDIYHREHDRDMDREYGKMYYSGDMNHHDGNYGDGRSHTESRYDRARRGYEQKKEVNGNRPENEEENMIGLQELLSVIDGDVREFKPKMSASEKSMAAQTFDQWAKMMKQL